MTLSETQVRTETLAQAIERKTHENVFLCYQCIKCTSGCPVAEHMDLNPNQVMRAIQFNDENVLQANTMWICASCQTCSTRCPQDIDIAGVMDGLRMVARERDIKPAVPVVEKFSKLFLTDIRLMGRLYEVGLMGGLNLWSGNLFKDMDLALEMLKKRKLHPFPSLPTRPPKKVEPIEVRENMIGYYPGCSAHSSALEYGRTIEAVCEGLGLELVEPKGWLCCGSTPAHSTDHVLATYYPIASMSIVERMGLTELTAPCSACYIRMKTAAHDMRKEPEVARQVNEKVGYEYQNKVRVMHLTEALLEKVGLEEIEKRVKKPLKGLKVACYYGCYITRPANITEAAHPEYPMEIDYFMNALGAETIDWSYKTDCCGGSLGLTKTELAHEMTAKILRNAHDCGADVMVTACPLCHVNLDGRQFQLDLDFSLPVYYTTQLATLALGLGEKRAMLNKNLVDAETILREKGLLS